MRSVYPLIMCGGVGMRLWPLSRAETPKQFHRVAGRGSPSFFQATIERHAGPGFHDPYVSVNNRYETLVRAQLHAIGRKGELMIEQSSRHTGPAVLAAALALQTPGCLTAQVKLRELPEVARGRAERLRPKQIAALEPFWADLSLDYEDNQKFLDERIAAAAELGDSVVPMLLEKLTPMQKSDAAVDLAGNCRRVLERLDPASFVDALAELARGNHGTAKSEAIILLGFADDPQSVAVLSDLLGDAKGWHRFHIVRSLRRLRAPGPAPKVVPYLGTDDRGLRKEVLATLIPLDHQNSSPVPSCCQ